MTVSSTEDGAEGAADTSTQDVNAAAPSDAGEIEAQGSINDAVNAALKEPEAAPASDGQDPKDPDSESTEADEISADEIKQLSEKAQHRFHELVKLRKTAEGEAAQVRQELDEIKPKAERMDQLTGYMREHNIPPEHLNNALGLTAMINKGDYSSALPVLENLLAQVRNAAGEVLPPDLREQVNLGYITEVHAKELHKARLGERRATDQVRETREKAEAERRQREADATVRTAVTTADAWSKEQVQSDPDWNLKRDRVTEKMELELRRLGPEGYPRTDKAVRELLGKIKQDVETELKRYRPTPRPVDPSPTGGSVSPRSQAKPNSIMDAVNGALAASE